MKKNMGFFVVFLLCLTFFTEGCSGMAFSKKEKSGLTGKKWLLEYAEDVKIPNQILITAEFIQGKETGCFYMSGSAGCNLYRSEINISESRFVAKHVSATKKACKKPVDIMQMENNFINVLRSSAFYYAETERLELKNSDGKNILVFRSSQPE